MGWLVSIIVPIYNADKYLRKCIESILNQTYKNFELILINDSSTDESQSICIEYANRDSRIICVKTQDKTGPSSARNKGISISRGDYILFVDSDDYIEANTVELLVKEIEDADVVISAYNKIHFDGNFKVESVTSVYDGLFKIDKFMSIFGTIANSGLFHYIWNKLYKSHIIKNNDGVRFNDDLRISEDMDFNIKYFQHVSYVKITNFISYNHIFYNNASITRNYISDLFDIRKSIHLSLVKYLESYNMLSGYNKEIVEKLYARRVIGCFYNLFRAGRCLSMYQKTTIIKTIVNDKPTREVLNQFSKYRFTSILIKYKLTQTIYLLYFIRFNLDKLKKALKKYKNQRKDLK